MRRCDKHGSYNSSNVLAKILSASIFCGRRTGRQVALGDVAAKTFVNEVGDAAEGARGIVVGEASVVRVGVQHTQVTRCVVRFVPTIVSGRLYSRTGRSFRSPGSCWEPRQDEVGPCSHRDGRWRALRARRSSAPPRRNCHWRRYRRVRSRTKPVIPWYGARPRPWGRRLRDRASERRWQIWPDRRPLLAVATPRKVPPALPPAGTPRGCGGRPRPGSPRARRRVSCSRGARGAP